MTGENVLLIHTNEINEFFSVVCWCVMINELFKRESKIYIEIVKMVNNITLIINFILFFKFDKYWSMSNMCYYGCVL